MPPAKKSAAPAAIDAFTHKDARLNIPTEELRDFVADDEGAPPVMRYPRDPSLDPQLVWKGKDEQDAADLAVPVVPIYIQEKIDPRALIEDLRVQRAAPAPAQLDLFADYDGAPAEFDQKIEFYRHPGKWQNRLILGDSLLTMTSLAEKEGLKGKVQTIYLDPPYGIKFGSNWQVSTRKRDVKDGKAEDATRQPEQIRAFRDTWQLGIHSYLAYLRDRLVVARELLTESGSIFVQIGDENVHLVRNVLDEVFGADNFVSCISFKKTGGQSSSELAGIVDYLLWYARGRDLLKYRQVYLEKDPGEVGAKQYNWLELRDGIRRPMSNSEAEGDVPPGALILQPYPLVSMGASASDRSFEWLGKSYRPSPDRHWSVTADGLAKLAEADRLLAIGNTLRFVNYLSDYPVTPLTNLWVDTQTSGFASDRTYVVQTLPMVITRCLLMTTDPGDLVLDPTCGSGTTAYVAEQWGRRWITIDTSRVALALARTRLMAARFPYYLLADSPEGIAKEAELTGVRPPAYATEGDLRKGFVYKRVPHVTLKSIANNPDIREGMTRAEIDRAIAKHAETETLVDQPYQDGKRVRVSGPFTVESLSPHRVLPAADDNADGVITPAETARQGDFATVILDNLRKAGVQNTKQGERLKLDRLEPYAGHWLNAEGEYTDAEGIVKRVAVSLGPEHGTVGPTQVKEAAKEAIKGIGFDLLLIAGFAFDAHVSEETKQFGRLSVLPVRMNPDLAMGNELLKKTGAGNLFMVFGEPDIQLTTADGQVTVEIKGVDIYDPTTGELRASSPDEIACWFIDTSYDEESFFVRHAYFTGADEPYKKLKGSLRAEIDEAAWASLYRTVSRPFPIPATGKIAVKAINHYGDEVLKVFTV